MNNFRNTKANDGLIQLRLMVVTATIDVLSAYAIPNYQSYIVRGKIAE